MGANKWVQVPPVWIGTNNSSVWHYKDFHGFIEHNQAGKSIERLSGKQLFILGNWIGALHAKSTHFKTHNKRTTHLNLERLHLRWTETLLPLINSSEIPESDPGYPLSYWLKTNRKLISGLNTELKKGMEALDNKYQTPVHGDLNASNLLWDKEGDKLQAVLDWEGSRLDFPIADLIVPLRKLIIGEGGINNFKIERLKSFAGAYGSIPADQVKMIVPAILISDVSFFTWQMKQPVHIERAMAGTRDFHGILKNRGAIEEVFSGWD